MLLIPMAPIPIKAQRAPTNNDLAQIWCYLDQYQHQFCLYYLPALLLIKLIGAHLLLLEVGTFTLF
jgi:hypothetical protein